MEKNKKIITKIKALVNKYGIKDTSGRNKPEAELTTAQMESNSSPIISNTKGAMTLVERFGPHKVTVVHYVNDNEVGEDFITYEDLSMDVLKQIEACINNWLQRWVEDYIR